MLKKCDFFITLICLCGLRILCIDKVFQFKVLKLKIIEFSLSYEIVFIKHLIVYFIWQPFENIILHPNSNQLVHHPMIRSKPPRSSPWSDSS